jgi:hypothetical protein
LHQLRCAKAIGAQFPTGLFADSIDSRIKRHAQSQVEVINTLIAFSMEGQSPGGAHGAPASARLQLPYKTAISRLPAASFRLPQHMSQLLW